MDMLQKQRELKLTILHRKGGAWHEQETSKLLKLTPAIDGHQKHPEYIVLLGHFTKAQTLAALGGGQSYTVTQVVGARNEQLPFPVNMPY